MLLLTTPTKSGFAPFVTSQCKADMKCCFSVGQNPLTYGDKEFWYVKECLSFTVGVRSSCFFCVLLPRNVFLLQLSHGSLFVQKFLSGCWIMNSEVCSSSHLPPGSSVLLFFFLVVCSWEGSLVFLHVRMMDLFRIFQLFDVSMCFCSRDSLI